MSQDSLKQKTKVGLYWKFAEQASNYGMTFVVGIFMARLLSPEDYGITAIPAVFLSVAGVFASAGFASAMIRKPELTEEDLSTSFYYSTGMGILLYALLFLSSPYIADFYEIPVLAPLIKVTSISFIYGPLGVPQSILLQRKLDFQTPTLIGVASRILSASIGIYMAYHGYGVWALTISTMIAGIVGLLCQWYVVRWYPKTGWSNESFKYLWGFGNKFIGSQLLNTIYNNITPVFVGKYYSTMDLGVYNRAESYAKLPSQNLQGVIEGVTYPVLSKMQDDPERLTNGYRRIIKTSAFIIFPLMMLFVGLARPLVLIMVTSKWEPAVILLQLLCFSFMWWPIHSINLNLLLVLGRSDLFLRLEIVKKIFSFTVLLVTLPFGLVTVCVGRIVTSFVSLFINTYYSKNLIDCGFVRQMKDILPSFVLSVGTCVIAYLSTTIIDSLWLQCIIGFILGGAFYIVGSLLLKVDGLKDALYIFKIGKC